MISKQEESLAAYLNADDKSIVQDFVNKNIIGPNKSMTAKQIYATIKDSLSRKDLSESAFMGSLSANVRGGYIAGVEGKRRVGYVKAGVKSIPAPALTAPVNASDVISEKEPAKAPEVSNNTETVKFQPTSAQLRNISKHAHHVWVGDVLGRYSEYRVLRTFGDLEKLVINVLGGRKSDNGLIVFNGERYACESSLIFEKLIVGFFGGVRAGESEPVLNDGSGIPVELRIYR